MTPAAIGFVYLLFASMIAGIIFRNKKLIARNFLIGIGSLWLTFSIICFLIFLGNRSFFNAVLQNDNKKVSEMISRNSNIVKKRSMLSGATALHLASHKGDGSLVMLLIKSGIDVNSKDAFGRTPLHVAAMDGNATATRTLLLNGAYVNATDSRSAATPMHFAANQGHVETVKILLDHGASRDARADWGNGPTPSELAEQSKHPEIVPILEAPTSIQE